jgi:hypothetical protein
MWKWTEAAPALIPMAVTRLGSPPKLRMLALTHLRARTWSFRPMFPVIVSSPVDRKPARCQEKLYSSFVTKENE